MPAHPSVLAKLFAVIRCEYDHRILVEPHLFERNNETACRSVGGDDLCIVCVANLSPLL